MLKNKAALEKER